MSEPIIFNENYTDDVNDIDDCVEDNKKTDFVKISGNIFANINYKQVIFMFFIGLIIFSDLFIDNVIYNIKDGVEGECPTTKGTIIQLTFFCLALIIVDLMIKYSWI